jgi:hypothetical protein
MSAEKFFQTIYGDYEKVGRRSARWDRQAKEYFSLLAEGAGKRGHNHELESEYARLRTELQKAGCDDPLVRYMTLRQTKDAQKAGREGTNEWTQVALDLDASGYHQYWKFFSYKRASQAHKSITGTSNSAEVIWFRQAASDRLIELLKDPRLPESVVLDSAYTWLINDLWSASNLRKYTYDQIESLLLGGWGDAAEAQLIRGAYYIKYAWVARGAGWASTVSEEGWRIMKERLAIARESLERSWIMKPLLETALNMQWVELGDSRGRKEMERWFSNAMELEPGNYDARMNKLNWLHVKWHGSVKEMLDYGKECLGDTNGTASLTLYDAHLELAKYHRQSEEGDEAEYLKRAEVWSDIKLAFETFFEAHPEATSWRHNYALAAYQSEAWEDLQKQIKLLGIVNYPYFGGKEAFEEMVRKAEQNVKEGVSL